MSRAGLADPPLLPPAGLIAQAARRSPRAAAFAFGAPIRVPESFRSACSQSMSAQPALAQIGLGFRVDDVANHYDYRSLPDYRAHIENGSTIKSRTVLGAWMSATPTSGHSSRSGK